MNSTNLATNTKLSLIKSVLMAVARVCVSSSIRLPELIELLKECFINVAIGELKTKSEKINSSKISIMTGINRKFIPSLTSKIEKGASTSKQNTLLKIIGLWLNGKNYSTDGRPKLLSCSGSNSQFARLVNAVSADLNHYTVLSEMLRLKLVKKVNDQVQLIVSIYQPREDNPQIFFQCQEDTYDMIESIYENLTKDNMGKNLHLTTTYDNIPNDSIEVIRNWFLVEGSKLHKKAREFLANHDKDLNPNIFNATGRNKVSFCTFSFIKDRVEND